MIDILSTNITSPLGYTSRENYLSVKDGRTSLNVLEGLDAVPGRICASGFSDAQKRELMIDGFTWFESLVIRSVKEALLHTETDISGSRTLFILSTTKCDVEELAPSPDEDGDYLDPGIAAEKIASYLGISTRPVVVCNACISGIAAQVMARRLISAGEYDFAVVCGADTLSAFTVAGFTSFKALSACECRPFDIERQGLNLGEAAATVILGKSDGDVQDGSRWHMISGCLNNDAYHVSAPAPDGDGVFRALRGTLELACPDDPVTVCAHGTATMFNDQMESKAIEKAGLGSVPVTAFKGNFGHTLGAAGILESIISMLSLDDGLILPVKGFDEVGVSGRISVNTDVRNVEGRSFLKIISGFGGCNGSVLYSKRNIAEIRRRGDDDYSLCRSVSISAGALEIDGENVPVDSYGADLLASLFRKYVSDTPRFYKMDLFSKLAFVASSLLLKGREDEYDPEGISVLFFNKTSSIMADRQHLATFLPPAGFYPSPSVFLYTLPNVVMGEIASKYNIKGETTFIILPEKDVPMMETIAGSVIKDSSPSYLLYGWVDCPDENNFCAELKLMKTASKHK